MSRYTDGTDHAHTLAKGTSMMLVEISREVDRARAKFPNPTCSTVALMEEVGELAEAMLKVSAGKWPKNRIREEAVQVAAMAIRIATEGDPACENAKYSEPD